MSHSATVLGDCGCTSRQNATTQTWHSSQNKNNTQCSSCAVAAALRTGLQCVQRLLRALRPSPLPGICSWRSQWQLRHCLHHITSHHITTSTRNTKCCIKQPTTSPGPSRLLNATTGNNHNSNTYDDDNHINNDEGRRTANGDGDNTTAFTSSLSLSLQQQQRQQQDSIVTHSAPPTPHASSRTHWTETPCGSLSLSLSLFLSLSATHSLTHFPLPPVRCTGC